MKSKYMFSKLFIAYIIFTTFTVFAQDNKTLDSNANSLTSSKDTIIKKEDVKLNIDYAPLAKSPTTAMLRSLAFPGLGQLYVENYWRAPVFAVAAGYLWYSVISNHIKYNDMQNQLNAISDTKSHEYVIAKSKRETAVDMRDMSVLYLIGVYTVSIIDAYVGSHLYEFNINDNLDISHTNNLLPSGELGWQIKLSYRF